ncbi:hypothetical protein LV75_002680 [Actinokineospora diospyrosa]|uniref:Uncharacterized protein n=1 Tax=Actinokineospora diospyrosa TaxID=103728 RepID=A0ABT1IC21_9PSEU|nr:hypothetical protein [Actinokineospora diospyrosa]
MTDQRTTVINTAPGPLEARCSTWPSSQRHTGRAEAATARLQREQRSDGAAATGPRTTPGAAPAAPLSVTNSTAPASTLGDLR